MAQAWIKAAFYRGGTSKGLVFHARDLPAERAAIEPILLAALGSPDPNGRQLNGMGGGLSSLSKAVIVGPPTHSDVDIDYTFAQIAVDQPRVDWSGNCGNLSALLGPFAVDEGLVLRPDGEALVRIHQVNTGRLIHARFEVKAGQAVTEGTLAIDGVAGTGACITLDILAPGGALTGRLLPTGRTVDEGERTDGTKIAMSLVDAGNAVAFVRARDLGLSGQERPDEIEARPGLLAELDGLRRQAGVLMGLADTPPDVPLGNPKIALLAEPAPFTALDGRTIGAEAYDIAIRIVSMRRPHRAVSMTGASCLAVACRVPGTLAQQLCTAGPDAAIRVGHPSGTIGVDAEVVDEGGWVARRTSLTRTVRRLMDGAVGVPAHLVPTL